MLEIDSSKLNSLIFFAVLHKKLKIKNNDRAFVLPWLT